MAQAGLALWCGVPPEPWKEPDPERDQLHLTRCAGGHRRFGPECSDTELIDWTQSICAALDYNNEWSLHWLRTPF